jgi:hypothetical protein
MSLQHCSCVPWLLAVACLALSPAASAQSCTSATGWISRSVFNGTAGSDIPVAVSLRAWGPTDEVFVVYERRFPTQTDMPHKLYLRGYTCTDSVCGVNNAVTTYAQQQISSTVYHDQYMHPAAAIDISSGGARKLAVVHRERINSCDGDSTAYQDEVPSDPEAKRLELREIQWYSNGDPTGSYVVERDPSGDNVCTDRGTPYARYNNSLGRTRACWRWDDDKPTSGAKTQIHCGRRDSSGSYTVTTLTNPEPSVSGILVDQDHVSFDLDPDVSDRRLVVHRSAEMSGDKLRLRFPDDTPATDLVMASADPGQPDFAISSTGVWHMVWHEGYGESSKIKHAWCQPGGANQCKVAGNWTTELVEDDGADLRHAQVNTDGDRVFVVFMVDPDGNGQYRVQYKTRCNSGVTAWEQHIAPAYPCTPTTASEDQSLLMGRPSTAVDRGSNVFHVGFLQVDALDALGRHNDGEVIWSRITYPDCP